MRLLRRSMPIISTLCLGVLNEALVWYPEFAYWFWAGIFVVVVGTQFGLYKKAHLFEALVFGVSQFLFLSGTYFFVFFVEGSALRQVVIGLALVINLFYLTNIFYYHFRTEKYQVNALQNISSYLNLISVFTISSVGFSLILYLGWSSWLNSLGIALCLSVLCYQTFWVNKIIGSSALWYSCVAGLIGGEIFWVTTFLPSSFLVNGIIVTVVNYSVVNLARYYFGSNLKKSVIWRYVIISCCVLLLTLVTARWS